MLNEEGIIDSIGEAVEEPVEEEVPVDAEEEVATEEVATEEEEEVVEDVVTREEFDALKTLIEEIKAKLELNKTTLLEKETEIKDLKLALSTEPATTKIKLGQEKGSNNKKAVPAKNSLGRIFQTINKNK